MKLESLKNEKFQILNDEKLRMVTGGEPTGRNTAMVGGEQITFESDCYEWINGRLHSEYYDKEGIFIKEWWQ